MSVLEGTESKPQKKGIVNSLKKLVQPAKDIAKSITAPKPVSQEEMEIRKSEHESRVKGYRKGRAEQAYKEAQKRGYAGKSMVPSRTEKATVMLGQIGTGFFREFSMESPRPRRSSHKKHGKHKKSAPQQRRSTDDLADWIML